MNQKAALNSSAETIKNAVSTLMGKILSLKMNISGADVARQDAIAVAAEETVNFFWPGFSNASKSIANAAASLKISTGHPAPNDRGRGRGHMTYILQDAINNVPMFLFYGLRHCQATSDVREALADYEVAVQNIATTVAPLAVVAQTPAAPVATPAPAPAPVAAPAQAKPVVSNVVAMPEVESVTSIRSQVLRVYPKALPYIDVLVRNVVQVLGDNVVQQGKTRCIDPELFRAIALPYLSQVTSHLMARKTQHEIMSNVTGKAPEFLPAGWPVATTAGVDWLPIEGVVGVASVASQTALEQAATIARLMEEHEALRKAIQALSSTSFGKAA